MTQPVTGVQRYAGEVIYTIDAMLAAGGLELPAAPVDILAPRGASLPRQLEVLRLRHVGSGHGQLWEQLELPRFCKGRVLYTPSGGSPLLHRRHVFTIPDAGVFATPHAYSTLYGTWYRTHHRLAVRNRHLHLLTVSAFSRSELARWLSMDAARITVTPLGHEHALAAASDPSVLDRLQVAPQNYILGVGSANPNKNFAALLQAFRLLQAMPGMDAVRLVIIGGGNARIFAEQDLQQPGVVRTGFLKDAELRALYENALCLAFPSLYEGFGLPPLEAMALGCPVACSSAASLPEVCGDAAVFFDPHAVDQLAATLARIAQQPALRAALKEAGKLRSRQFSWKQTARRTWETLLAASAG